MEKARPLASLQIYGMIHPNILGTFCALSVINGKASQVQLDSFLTIQDLASAMPGMGRMGPVVVLGVPSGNFLWHFGVNMG